jgi:hemolysin activation/secretion protein
MLLRSLFAPTLLAAVSLSSAAATTPPVVPTPQELAKPAPARTQPELAPARPVARELGKPEDEILVDVAGYRVDESAPAALREALPRLTAAFVGKQRSFEDLVNAANEVTRFLQRDLGYYLGYAYIPEGALDADGRVRIAVLEGRLDKVVLRWRDDLKVDRAVVQAYLDRLQPGAILTVKDVERAVFLVNDLRGLTVRAEVKAGSQPGTAILEFTPTPEARYSGSVDADDNGSAYIGRARLGGQVLMASPFGRGDSVSASLLRSLSGGLTFALVGYTTPLGGDGFKVGSSLSALHYQLDKKQFPLGLSGDGVTLNLFGLYPWLRSRNINLFVLGATNLKSFTDKVAAGGKDKRVDDLTLGLSGDFRDSLLGGAVNTFEANLAAGRLNYPGGAVSGLDDDPSYRKLTVSVTRLQNLLSNRLLLVLAGRAQFTRNNLDTTEQFRAGGPDSVRAFSPGEGTGDQGALVTAELRWIPPAEWLGKWSREIVASVFYDAGAVQFRVDPTRVARDPDYVNHQRLAGAGVGLVWSRADVYSMKLAIAHPTTRLAATPGSSTTAGTRFYAQGSWKF